MKKNKQKNMKILFLDDSDSRWKKFQSKVPCAFRAETADQCIRMIKERPDLDFLFLDHDLGGETWVDSGREDCGMEVVRFLCNNDFTNTIKKIIVHSHNDSAAREMNTKLNAAGYSSALFPFSYLIENISFNPPED